MNLKKAELFFKAQPFQKKSRFGIFFKMLASKKINKNFAKKYNKAFFVASNC